MQSHSAQKTLKEDVGFSLKSLAIETKLLKVLREDWLASGGVWKGTLFPGQPCSLDRDLLGGRCIRNRALSLCWSSTVSERHFDLMSEPHDCGQCALWPPLISGISRWSILHFLNDSIRTIGALIH